MKNECVDMLDAWVDYEFFVKYVEKYGFEDTIREMEAIENTRNAVVEFIVKIVLDALSSEDYAKSMKAYEQIVLAAPETRYDDFLMTLGLSMPYVKDEVMKKLDVFLTKMASL